MSGWLDDIPVERVRAQYGTKKPTYGSKPAASSFKAVESTVSTSSNLPKKDQWNDVLESEIRVNRQPEVPKLLKSASFVAKTSIVDNKLLRTNTLTITKNPSSTPRVEIAQPIKPVLSKMTFDDDLIDFSREKVVVAKEAVNKYSLYNPEVIEKTTTFYKKAAKNFWKIRLANQIKETRQKNQSSSGRVEKPDSTVKDVPQKSVRIAPVSSNILELALAASKTRTTARKVVFPGVNTRTTRSSARASARSTASVVTPSCETSSKNSASSSASSAPLAPKSLPDAPAAPSFDELPSVDVAESRRAFRRVSCLPTTRATAVLKEVDPTSQKPRYSIVSRTSIAQSVAPRVFVAPRSSILGSGSGGTAKLNAPRPTISGRISVLQRPAAPFARPLPARMSVLPAPSSAAARNSAPGASGSSPVVALPTGVTFLDDSDDSDGEPVPPKDATTGTRSAAPSAVNFNLLPSRIGSGVVLESSPTNINQNVRPPFRVGPSSSYKPIDSSAEASHHISNSNLDSSSDSDLDPEDSLSADETQDVEYISPLEGPRALPENATVIFLEPEQQESILQKMENSALSLVFDYLPLSSLLTAARVSRSWLTHALNAYSWRVSDTLESELEQIEAAKQRGLAAAARNKPVLRSERGESLVLSVPPVQHFPWGRFLSEGTYKSVFLVWNSLRRRMEAVSVMNVTEIASSGNLNVVKTELLASCLLGRLVRARICPNFIAVHAMFSHKHSPLEYGLWGDSATPDAPKPSKVCPFTWEIPDQATAEAVLARDASKSEKEQAKAILEHCARAKYPLIKPQHTQGAARARGTASSANVARTLNAQSQLYQYIRMELCPAGDLEEFVASQESAVLQCEMEGGPALRARDIHDGAFVLSSFFQMAFSLYSARERLSFRHFDVKLLNFFVKPAALLLQDELDEIGGGEIIPPIKCSVLSPGGSTSSREAKLSALAALETLRLSYCLPGSTFAIDLPLREERVDHLSGARKEDFHAGMVIKLADYGTAATSAATLDAPVATYNFTTLENTAPEFMLNCAESRQNYSADTFALGLCLLHLLTGDRPYEELMASVRCPAALHEALRALWVTETMAGPSGKQKNAKQTAPTASTAIARLALADGWTEVLADSLWRFCVLLGGELPPEDGFYLRSPVLALLREVIPRPAIEEAGTRGKQKVNHSKHVGTRAIRTILAACLENSATSAESIAAEFRRATELFAITSGSHSSMKRLRRRCARVPGLQDLLLSLLEFDPLARPSLKSVLLHESFVGLSEDSSILDILANADAGVNKIDFDAAEGDSSKEKAIKSGNDNEIHPFIRYPRDGVIEMKFRYYEAQYDTIEDMPDV